MNLRRCYHNGIGAAAVLAAGWLVIPANAVPPYLKVTNVSTNPAGTNEFYLTATNVTVTNIGGTNVQMRVFMDDPPAGGGVARLPCPMVEVNVGTMVICHFANKLTNNVEGASIHWHGIELNNDSDGTAVAQDSILPGQTYVYKFIAPRAGLFWYHSHMIPGTSTFNGMYGPLIVTNSNEATLVASNILPSATYTFPLVLSDISFTNGVPGKVVSGTNYDLNTLIQLCENNALGTNSADQPFCGPAGLPGKTVLVNGYPPILAGSFGAPTASSTPLYTVANNSRVRLQCFDAATSRDFYMSLHYPTGSSGGNTNLYHIGGQGGFLDNAVLDGGTQPCDCPTTNYNFLYNSGSIVIGAGMRADVMFYPSGTNGEIIELVGNPLPSPWNLSEATAPGPDVTNLPPNYPIAFFLITNTGVTNAPLAAGSPIVAGTSFSNVSLKMLDTNALIAPPAPSEGVTPGTNFTIPSGLSVPAGSIVFENGLAANAATNNGYTPMGPNITGYAAIPLDGNTGDGSFTSVPHPPSSIWARVGDVLQLAIINDVGGGLAMHPFHLHGFSMQPMYIYSANLQTNLYTFPYNEFLDTIEVYPGTAVVFRIQLTDRPNFADSATGGPVTLGVDSPTGGAVGRWLMHCHIFLHGTIGMITELNVVANTINRLEGHEAGNDSVVLANSSGAAWTATNNASWLHLSAPNESGTGNTNVVFSYDYNPGATRTGTLTVAGETVNVTQAGVTYVQAPGPVTQIVNSNNGIANPTDVAVDGSGNVYFCDSGNGAIKEWEVAHNGVATLIMGLSQPQDLALDGAGDIYFTQYPNNNVTEWSAATHALTVLPISGLSQPEGVAVDGAGNVYVACPGQNAIKKWTAANSNVTTLASGLNSPYGVAVDAAGNAYIADTGGNDIQEWLAANNSVITLVSSNSEPLQSPWTVAVDGSGDVYIADGNNNDVKEWFAGSRTLGALATGLSEPTGVAVDGAQNVYIADYDHNAVKELPYAFVDPSAINFNASGGSGVLPVVLPPTENFIFPFTPTADESWLTYNGVSNGVVSYSVSVDLTNSRAGDITVLGENIPITQNGPSFALATSNLLVGPAAGTNTVVLYTIPSIEDWGATANASWLHIYPFGAGSANVFFTNDANAGATRSGTLTIAGQTLTVTQAGSTYVQAPGPMALVIGGGLNTPSDLAVDGSGNFYFSDSGNNAIKKWTEEYNTVTTVFSNGLNYPLGVALDASTNVYVADYENNAVKEWLAASNTVITVVSNGLVNPTGVALDGMSNIYIGDPSQTAVDEWTAANSNLSTLVTGLYDPYSVAVDFANNVYITELSQDKIVEWVAATGTLITNVSGLAFPEAVAVDGSGNLYIANYTTATVQEWIAASGNLITLVASGLVNPAGLAVDGSQNVYIADAGNNAIYELPHAFVDPTPKMEGRFAGSDVLPTVLFPSENLMAPFPPTVNVPWLSIGSIADGVVTFDFTANNTTTNRMGDITLLGQTIPVTQAGVVPPPTLINARIVTNGVFQFGFTNANQDASFTVLFTTNLTVPLTNWIAIGTASNLSPGVLQFADTNASNMTRFYMIRSP